VKALMPVIPNYMRERKSMRAAFGVIEKWSGQRLQPVTLKHSSPLEKNLIVASLSLFPLAKNLIVAFLSRN